MADGNGPQVFTDAAWAVWEALIEAVRQRGIALGMVFIEGTSIRAHHKAAGAKKGGQQPTGDHREALGRPRGGWGTKACVIADGSGRAIAFALTPGQRHELPMARDLLDRLPDVPGWVVGDRGLACDSLRERIWEIGARPAIPPRRTDAPVACPDWIYANPPLVENLWARVNKWRAVATRYEKTEGSFLGVLCLAATSDWLKSIRSNRA